MVDTNRPFFFNDEIGFENERNTINELNDEGTYLYGAECIWIPVTLAQEEPIFGEYLNKTLEKGTPIRLIIDQFEDDFGAEDSGMYSKFGFNPNLGEATFHASIRYFNQFKVYPKEQDLVYYKKIKKLFEVRKVHTVNQYRYKIASVLYNFDHADISDKVTDTDFLSLETISDKDETISNIPKQTANDTNFVKPVINTTEKDGLGME